MYKDLYKEINVSASVQIYNRHGVIKMKEEQEEVEEVKEED